MKNQGDAAQNSAIPSTNDAPKRSQDVDAAPTLCVFVAHERVASSGGYLITDESGEIGFARTLNDRQGGKARQIVNALNAHDALVAVANAAMEWFAAFPHHGAASHFDITTAEELYDQLRWTLAIVNGQHNSAGRGPQQR